MIMQNVSKLQASSRFWILYRVAKQAARQVSHFHFGDENDGYSMVLMMVEVVVVRCGNYHNGGEGSSNMW